MNNMEQPRFENAAKAVEADKTTVGATQSSAMVPSSNIDSQKTSEQQIKPQSIKSNSIFKQRKSKFNPKSSRKLKLVAYDLLVLLVAGLVFMVLSSSTVQMAPYEILIQFVLAAVCIITSREICRVYVQVWRYSRTNSYIRLMCADIIGGVCYVLLSNLLPFKHPTLLRMANIILSNLIGAIALRYAYTWVFEASTTNNWLRKMFRNGHWLTNWVSGIVYAITGISLTQKANERTLQDENKIRIAIVGAGRIGAMLAEDLLNNPNAVYRPVCFIDIDREKIGRRVSEIPILPENEETNDKLTEMGVQEIVFALTGIDNEYKKRLYERYKLTGCKLKVYDYPLSQTVVSGKRQMREFDIEELLFRQPRDFVDERTRKYYQGKTILISGGGGSIGSELCRQIAKMRPRQLIILDVYENGAYDIQQELRIAYGDRLNLAVEIISVCDRVALDKVFNTYKPNVVLHAAAHKHVPLMEHNCCEAVRNNVFGTLSILMNWRSATVENILAIQ